MSNGFTYTLHGRVAEIGFDDGKVNAMALPFFEGLEAALDRALADDVGAVVLAGKLGMFSPGLNLKVLPTLAPDDYRRTVVQFGRTMLRVFTFGRPTVAAITGHAVAGGAMLAMACDVRVMADGPFRFHLNETAIGLPLPTWAMTIAASAIPVRSQTEIILHARPLSPAEALDCGVVRAAVAPDALRAHAHGLAEPLAAIASEAYRLSKERLRAEAVRIAEERLVAEMTSFPVPGR